MTAPLTVCPSSTAADLLDSYRPGSVFLGSARATMLADPMPLDLPGSTPPAQQVAALLAAGAGEVGDAVVAGAVPFDPGAPSRLALMRSVRRARPVTPGPGRRDSPTPAARAGVGLPSPAGYEAAVAEALARMTGHDALVKVVLARSVRFTTAVPVDVGAVLRRLAARDPHAYTYAVPAGAGRTLVGASPELLVSRTGRVVASHPLAGSAPRAADPDADRANAQRLLASAKDLREHALVVDAVVEALRPYCRRLDVPRLPSLTSTTTMWHLGTPIRGELSDPSTTSIELVEALHPTPAVCGVPTAAARDLIAELEPFDRGLYAGAVGWCDASGDGEWAVTLRCALVEGDSLVAYAGAGIVPGSEPAAELAETAAKLRTVLQAMGLTDRPAGPVPSPARDIP